MMYLGNQAVGLATSIPTFGEIAQIEVGNYTPSADELVTQKIFPHSFGVIPDFLIVCNDSITISSAATIYLLKGHVIKQNVINDSYTCHVSIAYTKSNSTTFNNATGNDNIENYFTTSDFHFPGPATAYLKSGLTYHYIIGTFKEVTSNA